MEDNDSIFIADLFDSKANRPVTDRPVSDRSMANRSHANRLIDHFKTSDRSFADN